MRNLFVFAFILVCALQTNARTLKSGLLYTDPSVIAKVNAAQQKGATEYYDAVSAAAASSAQTNQVITINGNGNVVNNDVATISEAAAVANGDDITDSTDVSVFPDVKEQSPSPAPSPPIVPSPVPSPSPVPCFGNGGGLSPSPSSSPSPSASPYPPCSVPWKTGSIGAWKTLYDVEFSDPIPLVGCDGKDLSPSKKSTLEECAKRCGSTPGCFSFYVRPTSGFCGFVTNDGDSPLKFSKGTNAATWDGSVETVGSSFLPSNCAPNATVPHA